MEIKIINEEKNELEFEIDNQTIVELIRVYLNQDSNVKLGAWKKEHYSKPLKMKIVTEGKTPKKALQDAITKIQKELAVYKNEFIKTK
jgi:DNA-directed RNA polymerase subunit L